MPLVLISSPRFADHQTPPGHPERAERAEVMDFIAREWQRKGGEVVAPRTATHEQLTRVHAAEYVRRIEATAGSAVALDPDTYTSAESCEVALLAAGAAVDAVERAMDAPGRRALALVRPPGHHAERDRAMGFCFYNNAAIAAAHARARGAARVAIVDYDVHHGNGTQHVFETDPDVLYVSIHQSPYYPGTGDASETGLGRGTGFTVNLPMEAGAVDDDYRLAFTQVVAPVMREFEPDLVVVSAGFDAHERDPLGGMRLTAAGFAAMTRELRHVADACCGGRIAVVIEGGYDLHALRASLSGVIEALESDDSSPAPWPASPIAPDRGRASVAAARAALGRYWSLQD
jgi:acetoin utilization deacetylase AcuC-like enzyme